MSALAEPRTGLRDVEPYVSPQLDVAAPPEHERVPAPACRRGSSTRSPRRCATCRCTAIPTRR